MANVDKAYGARAVQNMAGGMGIPTWEGLLLSNTLIAHGDILYATVGYITTVQTPDLSPIGVAVSFQKTSITTNPKVLFTPALESIVFEAQCSGTLTQALIWTTVDHEGTAGTTTTGSVQEINENAASIKDIQLIGISKRRNTSFGLNSDAQFIFAKSKFTGKTWQTNGPGTT